MKCPECGIDNSIPHTADGAGFKPDGHRCLNCLAVFHPQNVQYRLTQINRLKRRLKP